MITSAIHNAGYKVKATMRRARGAGERITFATSQCWLGAVLVAASQRGICAIALGDDAEQLAHDLHAQFPHAELRGSGKSFESQVAIVIGFMESPALGLTLPLDIRGTPFQQRVWQALQQIPAGERVSYTELATRLGQPQAVRAVASACAANRLAAVIPCHRVVRTDGSLSGYRWGVERKRALLDQEANINRGM